MSELPVIPRLTSTGKPAKNQYDLTNIVEYFKEILSISKYGFAHDKEKGKSKKVLYHVKTVIIHLSVREKINWYSDLKI